MPLYDFVCPAGHATERRAGYSVEVVACDCGQTASRRAVNRIGFSGFAKTPQGKADFYQDYRRFSEASSEMDYKASRYESEGATVTTPNFFKAAKEQAAGMVKAGEA